MLNLSLLASRVLMFMKDLAMAGGLLALSQAGAGGFSLDAKLRK